MISFFPLLRFISILIKMSSINTNTNPLTNKIYSDNFHVLRNLAQNLSVSQRISQLRQIERVDSCLSWSNPAQMGQTYLLGRHWPNNSKDQKIIKLWKYIETCPSLWKVLFIQHAGLSHIKEDKSEWFSFTGPKMTSIFIRTHLRVPFPSLIKRNHGILAVENLPRRRKHLGHRQGAWYTNSTKTAS